MRKKYIYIFKLSDCWQTHYNSTTLFCNVQKNKDCRFLYRYFVPLESKCGLFLFLVYTCNTARKSLVHSLRKCFIFTLLFYLLDGSTSNLFLLTYRGFLLYYGSHIAQYRQL